jgi:predicted dehydrogenase
MAQSKQYGVAVAGFDHWYIGRAAVDAFQHNPRARIVAVAHRDAPTIEQYAAERGLAGVTVTTDYAAVVRRDDVDLVVTGCPTAENVELCLEAVRHGKAIISVKPFAMSLDAGDRLVQAVREAGTLFYPFEAHQRPGAQSALYRQWLSEGRIGKPISATAVQRGSLQGASMDWPGRQNPNTWWRDPAKVPGGGWLDHSIYHVDFLRWLLGEEVVRVSGVAKTLAHPDLQAGLEDFGVALLEFAGGAVATVEVTWASPPSGGLSYVQIVGSEGQIAYDQTLTGRFSVAGTFDSPAGAGWTTFAPPRRQGTTLYEHVLDCLDGKAQPAATVQDARANLAACLAFYEAARSGRTVSL